MGSTKVRFAYPTVVSTSGANLLVDGRPFKPWGLRAASASQTDVLTAKLISALDSWSGTKLNTVNVFYQGSSGGNARAFAANGLTFDSGHETRMNLIARECLRRGIVLIVGLFYQNATELTNIAAYEAATRLAADSLAPFPNVIINIANEANSGSWGTVFDANDASVIGDACGWVHAEDADRIVGSGGYGKTLNKSIGAESEVDIVLYDSFSTQATDDYHGDLITTNGNGSAITNKPSINVETFGSASCGDELDRGVVEASPTDWFDLHRDDIDYVRTANTGLLFHWNAWTQVFSRQDLNGNPFVVNDARFDFGDGTGAGTLANPGWKWWSDYVG